MPKRRERGPSEGWEKKREVENETDERGVQKKKRGAVVAAASVSREERRRAVEKEVSTLGMRLAGLRQRAVRVRTVKRDST